jgi:TonB family protein
MRALKSAAIVAAILVAPIHAEPQVAGEPPQASDADCELPLPRPKLDPSKTYPVDYPSMSLRNREQGEVALSMCINAKGEVSYVKVTKSSGFPRLDEATVKRVARWQFLLALDACGKPIDWCDPPYTVSINWQLPGL